MSVCKNIQSRYKAYIKYENEPKQNGGKKMRTDNSFQVSIDSLCESGFLSQEQSQTIKEYLSLGTNFVINGDVGSGKTTLAAAMMNTLSHVEPSREAIIHEKIRPTTVKQIIDLSTKDVMPLVAIGEIISNGEVLLLPTILDHANILAILTTRINPAELRHHLTKYETDTGLSDHLMHRLEQHNFAVLTVTRFPTGERKLEEIAMV